MATPFPSRCDALVVGARPAGAATALLLARAGVRVLAVDRGSYGADTLSTHALMRGAAHQLASWDALARIRASGTPPVTTTTFRYGRDELTVDIKPRGTVDALYAPRRTVLDAVLVDLAREAGADVRHGVRLGGLRWERGRVAGAILIDGQGHEHHVATGIVVGADGLSSNVARQVAAERYLEGQHAAAVVYGHFPGVWVQGYYWYYAPGATGGAIPTTAGQTCVFASVPANRFADVFRRGVADGFRATLAPMAPEMMAHVAGAGDTVRLHGFGGQPGFFRRSWGPGWALVGDAAHFKDPITAHGITDALRDADLLARAIAEGTEAALARYQDARDVLARPIFDVTEAIASFSWDLASLPALHRKLSEGMAQEVRVLEDLSGTRPRADRDRAASSASTQATPVAAAGL